MGNSRNHTPNFKKCMCDKCGVEGVSRPGSHHRRCSGQADAPIRAKHQNLPSADRGKWQ